MIRTILLLLGAALLAAPASALYADEGRRIAIPIAGVRLHDEASVTTLKGRIARAARQVCDTRDKSLRAAIESDNCEKAAIESAEGQLARFIERNRFAAASLGSSQ